MDLQLVSFVPRKLSMTRDFKLYEKKIKRNILEGKKLPNSFCFEKLKLYYTIESYGVQNL